MDAVSITELKRSVECSICYEPRANPKVLPCQHSFCKECLDEMIKFNDDGSGIINCPLKCHGEVLIKARETTNSLPNNYSLQSVLDIIDASQDKMKIHCRESKDCSNTSCYSCSDCSLKTCISCWDTHECTSNKYTTIKYNQNSSCFYPWCKEHETYAKFICFHCDESFICTYCMHRNHKNHEKNTIQRYTTDTRDGFTSQINEYAKYEFQQSNVSYADALNEIKSIENQLEKELQDRIHKQISNFVYHLKCEKDALLREFSKASSIYTENLKKSNLLHSDVMEELAALGHEINDKLDFEIISERKAIIKKIDAKSMLHFFGGNLSSNYSEKHLLGELRFDIKRFHGSESRTRKVVEFQMEHVYKNTITKENDLKSIRECVSELFMPEEKKVDRELPKKTFKELKDLIANDQIDELASVLIEQPDVMHVKDECTLIHLASTYGKKDSLHILLQQNDGLINKRNCMGFTPLTSATLAGNTESMDILLQNHADINIQTFKSKKTALMIASILNQKECVNLLLKNNADVNIQDIIGNTALMIASNMGNADCVISLLENNANVNIQDNNGFSAIMGAADRGHKECVNLLLKNNANVEVQDEDGSSAIMVAATRGHEECVNLLLKSNANVNVTDKYGDSALMHASLQGHHEVLKLLLQNNADVNTRDEDGDTALILAAKEGNIECVKLLLRSNIEIFIENNDGNTAHNVTQSDEIKLMLNKKIYKK